MATSGDVDVVELRHRLIEAFSRFARTEEEVAKALDQAAQAARDPESAQRRAELAVQARRAAMRLRSEILEMTSAPGSTGTRAHGHRLPPATKAVRA